MRLGIFVLTITTVSSDIVRFEVETDFLNREAFLENTLEFLSNVSRPGECATHCAKCNTCSAFGFNVNTNVCQLLGDLMFREASLFATLQEGQRYYSIRKAWCPLEHGFHVFRGTGLCLRWTDSANSWNEAALICNNVGGRLAVLNSEEKREAVFSAVSNIGSTDRYHLGASDADTEDTWIWSDGTLMSQDWFDDGEPSKSPYENCLLVVNRKAHDVGCTYKATSICEIIEN